ncbi:hypothetical protein EON80_09830 [bacterium]|nr:MAG: hypothetical protein EON80_09830 [bacterium]
MTTPLRWIAPTLFLGCCLSGCRSTPAPIAVDIASNGDGYRSRASVDAAGKGQSSSSYDFGDRSANAPHKFKVTKRQQKQLQDLVKITKFFKLDSEYGDAVLRGPEISVKITQGKKAKVVTLLDLEGWAREKNPKLKEVDGVIKIIKLVGGWAFSPPKPKAQ